MEYPGSKFTRPWRLTLLSVFIAAFFIIAPILVLYASGYRYDWQNGLIKETGAINVDVSPKEATVYLNGVFLKGAMPYRIKNITPGKYRLKITAPGYFDWVKDVEVRSKQTVYIKDISLLKQNAPRRLAAGQIKNAALSADGKFLIFSRLEGGALKVWHLNLRDASEMELARFPADAKIKIVWAGKNNYAALSEAQPPYKTILLVNGDKPAKRVNLTQKTKEPILKYQWKQSAEPELFFGTKKTFSSILPRLEQIYNIAKSAWLDWTMENGQLWVLRQNSAGETELISDLLGFKSVFKPIKNSEKITLDNTYNLIAAAGGRVLLRKKNTAEMALLTAQDIYKINGEKFSVSPYADWWLIWTPWELTTHSQGEEPYLLNRSGEELKEVLPLDEANTLGLVWQNEMTVFFPYYLVSHNLINRPITAAAADSERRILYFGAEIDSQEGLWELKY